MFIMENESLNYRLLVKTLYFLLLFFFVNIVFRKCEKKFAVGLQSEAFRGDRSDYSKHSFVFASLPFHLLCSVCVCWGGGILFRIVLLLCFH